MDTPQFRRLVGILGEAMELPAGERDAFVERACGDDAALLAEARSLLDEARRTSFEAVTARIGAGVARAARPLGEVATPERIGPYRILGVLGEGGMGLVYRAEQSSPIRREVALKIVRGGLFSENARARFEAERQALAVMSHPGIASIYDAGATADGVPYFVMELVRGEPITGWCDQKHLGIDGRLSLFMQVCHAVQHAHMNGVIHRDLKPSNILVADVDGHPQPRVIDFGIAKAVETTAAADTETMHTAFGAVMGTLEYMSPEQAGGGAAPIDTRSDVYSLGVILYELVTGSLPFESGALRAAGAAEAQRIIRDTDPPTPARRFTETDAREATARVRSTDERSLKRRLNGDLGWIIMKALEKDPARRYQSASDLAADLGRLRDHQPVEAGPPSRRYRAGRFVRRHRTGVVAASVVLVALIAGVTLATVGLVRAKRAQRQAENEAQRATLIKNFLTGMLAEARPDKSHGREVTVLEVVDSTAARLERGHEFEDAPLVRADVVHAIAETYRSLDQYDRAIPLFRQAIALKRSAAGNNAETTLISLNKLSESQAQSGDLAGAIETQQQVVVLAERVLGKDSDKYSAWLSNLGNMYADKGDLAAAERILRESLAIDRRILHKDNEAMPISINNLAIILVDEGKCADAIPLHEESLAMRRRMFGVVSSEFAVAIGNYARALDCVGRFPEAESAADSSVSMCEIVFGPNHVRTATSRMRLAEVYLHTGRAAQAEPLLRSAIATFQGIRERYWRVGDARALLGEALLALGNPDGIHELEAGWEILTETTRPNAPRSREIAARIATWYDHAGPPETARLWHQRADPASM